LFSENISKALTLLQRIISVADCIIIIFTGFGTATNFRYLTVLLLNGGPANLRALFVGQTTHDHHIDWPVADAKTTTDPHHYFGCFCAFIIIDGLARLRFIHSQFVRTHQITMRLYKKRG
jgi:hypothetical protein